MEYYPDVWVTAGSGHIGAGEKEVSAMVRELKEEVGIITTENKVEFLWSIKGETICGNIVNNEFYYVYLYKFDGNISNLKLQEEEVQKVKWFSINKINQELELHPEKYLIEKSYWKKVSTEIKKRVE